MTDRLRLDPAAGLGGACPEQYDVYCGDVRVGYLRLRHGLFRADYFPPPGGRVVVYEAEPEGDGIFQDDERKAYLSEACAAIQAAMDAPQAAPVPVEPSGVCPDCGADVFGETCVPCRNAAASAFLRHIMTHPSGERFASLAKKGGKE